MRLNNNELKNMRKLIVVIIVLALVYLAVGEYHKAGQHDASNLSFTDWQAAALDNELDKIKQGLAQGFELNQKNAHGQTVLHYAALNGHSTLVNWLIAQGAEIIVQDNNLYTPLFYACVEKDNLQHQALVDKRDERLTIIKQLLALGADLNIQNKQGKTLLHCAEQFDNLSLARFFLEQGGDPQLSTVTSKSTALQLAKKHNKHELVALIQRFQAGSNKHLEPELAQPVSVIEPYPLTEPELTTLLMANSSQHNINNRFELLGASVSMIKIRDNMIVLEVKVDRRLNLYSGRPNDLASGHGGKLVVKIHQVLDQNHNDLYDAKAEPAWQENVIIYRNEDGSYRGTRQVMLKPEQQSLIKKITGSLQFSTPIAWSKHQLVVDSTPQLSVPITHALISSANFSKHSLKLNHPTVQPDFVAYLAAFDASGQLLPVIAYGVAGVTANNHYYNFGNNSKIQHLELMIAGKSVQREIPFEFKVQRFMAE
jgi:ankyrin repeat protein